MTHGHSHAHSHEPLALPKSRLNHIRILLAALVVPLAVLTVVGMFWLWPSSPQSPVGSLAPYAENTTAGKVEVTSLDERDCAQLSNPMQPVAPNAPAPPAEGGRLAPSAVCATVIDGEGKGDAVALQIPPEVYASLTVGTVVKVLHSQPFPDGPGLYHYWDVERTTPMVILIAIYLLLVVVVARWRGAAAIAGLAASILILVYFVMPSLMAGNSPLAVTLVGVCAMMFSSVYFAHGVSIRTTTALLGTFGGLLLTVLLAMWQVRSVHLSGATSEDAQFIFGTLPTVALPSLLICGIVIAGLGALNDVTITQASAIWELHAANPQMGRARLFARAMRIGRDHIASTVYTLAFAYAGTALPALLLAMMVDRPWWDIVTSSDIAEEIVRTLIASIGLIAAIPLTTFIGALLIHLTAPVGSSLEQK
ncbi:MAG: YibE/F family protein [Actinomycetaceae bacterium]|nr:YibE/F family protein [Actinomycetaceae bacterium]